MTAPARLLLVGLAVLLPARAAASFDRAAAGTSSGSFLKLGVGARAMAMGEAYSALADDATGVYWNPAAMVQIPDRHSLTFMHAEYLAGIAYDFLGYSHKVRENAAWGGGLQYLSFGEIAETNASGVQVGSAHPQDLAATLAAGYELRESGRGILDGLALGGGVKYVRSRIVRSAETFSLDAGLLSPRLLGERLRLSLVGQNLAGRLRFDQVSEPLPTTLKLGAGLRLGPSWLWGLDLFWPRDNDPAAALGTEYRLDFASGRRSRLALAGRMGYNSRGLGDVAGLAGASFGVGFLVKERGSLDYALAPFGGLGLTHRVSVSLKIGN